MARLMGVGAGMARGLYAGASMLLLMCALLGCKVTGEDVETWKRTVKGPGKMVAVMLADKYPLDLRTSAALALVEMDRSDKDGPVELQKALERIAPAVAGQIIIGLAPGLQALMHGSDADDEAPQPLQIRAKDAAFLLIPLAPARTKIELTEAVVDWYIRDFNGRNLAGKYSAEQAVRALGSPAAKRLVKGLNPKLPQQALVKLVELIGQLADQTSKAEAAARLIEIEKEMEGPKFYAWLEGRIREQMQDGDPNAAVDPKRLAGSTILNREKFINNGALPSMKYLADEPAIRARLLAIASKPDKSPLMVQRRTRALQALEGKAGKDELQALLALALNNANPAKIRDYAFDRVGDVRSPAALPQLWPLVKLKKEERLRWRAGEMVLSIGGVQVVNEFFESLPDASDVNFPPQELAGYATRLGQLSPLPSASLRKRLTANRWTDRVIALRFFERKGSKDDVRYMKVLSSDLTRTKGKGWDELKTVGDVAKESIETLKARIKPPA